MMRNAAVRRANRRFGQSLPQLLTAVLLLFGAVPSSLSYTVGFEQIDWLDNQGGYNSEMSDWGFAKLQLSSADAGLFQSGPMGYLGYLNITTSVPGGGTDNWAVRNMPLLFSSVSEMDLHSNYGLNFDLGITPGSTRVTSLSYELTIDAAPRASAPLGLQTPASVDVGNWLFGGAGQVEGPGLSVNTGNSVPGKAANFAGAGPGNPAVAGGFIRTAQTNIVSVNEDINGCVPGATTRSLFYLKTNGSISFSGSVSNVYQSLVNNMNSSVGTNSTGTKYTDFLTGKQTWAASNLVDLTTLLETSVTNAFRSLTNGADIEAWIQWRGTNSLGQLVTNGHLAFVSSLTIFSNGSFRIGLIDSPQNGSTTNRFWDVTIADDGFRTMGGNTNDFSYKVWFVSEIPEPSFAALGAISLVALALTRRRIPKWPHLPYGARRRC